MKIALLSPNPDQLRDMGAALQAQAHSVTLTDGSKTQLRTLAEQEQPDLMLVDSLCCDLTELAQVEYVTTHHPATAVILLCETHTPEFLIHAMRAGVREVLPCGPPGPALQAAVARVAAKLAGGRSAPAGRVVAFMPCKGGSGATFLATNLGFQLAEKRSVLVIHLNLQFGDALSFVHDGKPMATLSDVARDISRLDASLLAACTVKVAPNFSVLAAPEELTHALEVKPEHIDAIVSLAQTQYDFVLLDVGRTLDTIAIRALDCAHRIYAVLQSGLPQVRNAAKLLAAFKALGYAPAKTELILNRFERRSEIGLDQIQRALGTVLIHTVPNSYKDVSAAINHGDPLLRSARSNAVVRQLAELAAALNPQQEESRGLLGRLFRRA